MLPHIDSALLQALKDPKERATGMYLLTDRVIEFMHTMQLTCFSFCAVLRCEELVDKFIRDPQKEVLEFPQNFSNYHRMLAHKVAQYYHLQTSSVDYEGGCRVIAQRTIAATTDVVSLFTRTLQIQMIVLLIIMTLACMYASILY